jgi:predicted regulator of Ras-like GTPase activity (Roadblock/LC7/MglB family)
LAEIRSAASEIEFDAGKLMDDFDLPDAGFETHVFSTAELVDDEAIPHPPLGRMTQFGNDAPQSAFSIPITEYQSDREYSRESNSDSAPFGDYLDSGEQELGTMPLADLLYLTSEQEARARRQLEEVSLIADVIFVKLMAGDGSVMLEAGMESGDSRTNQHLAGLIAVADLETDRRALGSVSGITLESPEGVLVLSPLHGGAVLATLLGNPARLGTLRRQLKKPVGSLRGLLMESSV